MKKLITRLTVAALFLITASPTFAQTYDHAELVSTKYDPQVENSHSGGGATSDDGRYIAFLSDENLTPGEDEDCCLDVYVKDRVTESTELITHAEEFNGGVSATGPVDISADGRYVTFTFQNFRIYVYDRITQTATLVSKATDGTPANERSNFSEISANGRYVTFWSMATNLDPNYTVIIIPNPNNPEFYFYPYVHDLQTGTTELVGINQNGDPSGLRASDVRIAPSISADGRYVGWQASQAAFPSQSDIFVRDRTTETTETVDAGHLVALSGDGNSVLYFKNNEQNPIRIFNRPAQSAATLSVLNGDAFDISDDGRYVLLRSQDTNLVQNDTNGENDIFIYDALNQTYQLISLNYLGQQLENGSGVGTDLSNDGRYAILEVPGDESLTPDDIDNHEDVYIIDSTLVPPPTSTEQTVTLNSTADTYVRSGNANQNEGAGLFMRVQNSGNNRALVQFNQSEITNAVGSGEVLSAKLRLTITDNGNNWGTTGRTVDLHRLVTPWAEGNGNETSRGTGAGATWNCAIDSAIQNLIPDCNGATDWNMGIALPLLPNPWESSPTDTETITNNQTGVIEYDVTTDIQNFMNGTDNYGWIIKKTNEGANGTVSFSTKEGSSIPQLVITYQP